MNKRYFDVIIIGAGVSGLILAYEISKRTNKSIAILEKEKKNTIMLGDSETDANTAKTANIHFVLIKDGYTEKNLTDIHHDHLIEDFEVVKDIASNYLKIKE